MRKRSIPLAYVYFQEKGETGKGMIPGEEDLVI